MKDQQRAYFKAIRQAISKDEQERAAHALLRHLIPILDAMNPRPIIAGYVPIQNEFDIAPLMEALSAQNYQLVLPITRKDSRLLDFAPWTPTTPMKQNYLTPTPDTDARMTPTLLLVPLLAIDAKGNRLGYGKGYYDATIRHLKKENPGLMTIGIAFEKQLSMEKIPATRHDTPLKAVATELRYIALDGHPRRL